MKTTMKYPPGRLLKRKQKIISVDEVVKNSEPIYVSGRNANLHS
jgi:hypothetical protein